MTVYLVGAGPGDPDLLTRKADRLLAKADVVVHDRLVSPEIMELVAPWATRIDVGKDPNGSSVPQEEINRILVELGQTDGLIVRLKGGDPFVLGRGGEEAAALELAGISYGVVPGVTSAVAAPAAAGIPVTHRGVSSGFIVLTGFQNPNGKRPLDWEALARLEMTLIILMGAAQAPRIRGHLLDAGADPRTDVAIVYKATTADQETTRTKLRDLGNQKIKNPSVIVIGPAAGLEFAGSNEGSAEQQQILSNLGVPAWQ